MGMITLTICWEAILMLGTMLFLGAVGLCVGFGIEYLAENDVPWKKILGQILEIAVLVGGILLIYFLLAKDLCG